MSRTAGMFVLYLAATVFTFLAFITEPALLAVLLLIYWLAGWLDRKDRST